MLAPEFESRVACVAPLAGRWTVLQEGRSRGSWNRGEAQCSRLLCLQETRCSFFLNSTRWKYGVMTEAVFLS